MADIWCSRTDLEAQHCDGEEFQPKHPVVLSGKVIGCCLGLHTPCQCRGMWGSVEMAGIRCAFTYQAAQHCRNQQAEVLVHAGNTRASPPTQLRRRRRRRRRRHAAAAASLGRKVAQTPPRRKGSQKCWRRIPTETRERSVRESDWFVSSRADLKLWQRRILIETFESAQQCIQI